MNDSLFRTMTTDVRGMVLDRGRGSLVYAASVVLKVLIVPRIQGVLLFRLSHAAYQFRLIPLAYFFQTIGFVISGAEVHPAAQIGPGFCLVHSSGVVIGKNVRVGAHFICFHGVTLGDVGGEEAQPTLGDWVTATAGAKLLGGIRIGDRAVIGANAVVLADVPAGGVAVGIPARVVKIRSFERAELQGHRVPNSRIIGESDRAAT